MVVTSPDNFARTRRLRFTQQGVKRRHRAKALRMAPGDRICWYVTRVRGFAATATVVSPCFTGTQRIWVSEGAPDAYPWRVRIRRDHAVPVARAVPAATLAARLRFVRRWPASRWGLAFQGNLHELGAADFARIERAVAAA